MLQQIREASRGWLAAILMGFLVISFAIWGIADIFRIGTTSAVAEVGGQEIGVERLRREINRVIEQFRSRTGQNLTLADVRDRGLDRAMLDNLVEQTLIATKLRALGLSASDDEIRAQVRTRFQTAGQFDRPAFDRFLSESGLSESEFIELVRLNILGRQLLNVLHAGPSIPGGYINALLSHENERRIAEYITIPAEKAGAIADPGDEALKVYIAEHESQFMAPEYRALSYVAVSPEDLMPKIDITEVQIRAVYETRKAAFSTPEKRILEQIQFETKEAAEAAKAKIDGGTPFATVAAEAGFKPEDIVLGEVDKGDSSVPAGAFEIPAGSVSAPLEGPFGWVVIRAVSITPGTEKSFESVHQEIRDGLAHQEAVELVREESNKIEDALGAGLTLEEVAKEVGYPLRQIPAIDAAGRDPDGKQIEGLASDPVLLRTVFDKNRGPGEESEVTASEDGSYFVARIDSIAPSAVRPFAEIREDALKAYQSEERKKKLAALADDLTKRGNSGTSFDDISAELGARIQSSGPVARSTRTPQFSEGLVEALFAAKPESYVSGPTGGGDEFIVARLVDVAVIRVDKPEERTAFSNALQSQIVDDLERQFVQAARQELGVKINETLFQSLQPREQ